MQNQFLEDITKGKQPTIKRMIVSLPIFMLGAIVVSLIGIMTVAFIAGFGSALLEMESFIFEVILEYSYILFSSAGGIIGIFLFVRLYEKRDLKTLGFYKKDNLKQYGIGFLGGAVSITVIVVILQLLGQVKVSLNLPSWNIWLVLGALGIVLTWIIQGAGEEVLCRGYLLPALNDRFNIYIGVIGSSIIFSMLHLANNEISFIALLNLFLVGVVFALIAIKQKSLWGACAYHTSWNLVQGNVFGVEVSGIVMNESLMVTEAVGVEILTGGAFGIEASILTTLLLVGTNILLVILIRKQNIEEKITQENEMNVEV